VIDSSLARERAVLAAIQDGTASADADRSLNELESLVRAAGGEVVGRVIQRRQRPDPHTYIGRGKTAELALEKARVGFDLLVADDELTPAQQKSLEKALDVRVIDRSAVILDIFAKHAQSREGRLQVELAQLEYRLPRLAGVGRELSRLGGGINTRGPGESKLESDRQVIRRRITDLKKRLSDVAAQRERGRRGRLGDGLFLASLVGYTNAGKSTLLNALTGAGVYVADQPFATLDPTTRRFELDGGRLVLVSDTVGFIRKLPPTLVAAFRATLEELRDADLIVHVADAASDDLEEQMRAVNGILSELDLAAKPTLLVFNKADVLASTPDGARRSELREEYPDALFVSAQTGEGLSDLRKALGAAASTGWRRVRITLSYDDGALLQRVRERGTVRSTDYGPAGITLEADVPPGLAGELRSRAG
jgi:GTPase